MIHYLVLQNNYDVVEIGLLRDSRLIAQQRIAKTEASKLLVPSLDRLLKANGIQLADISAIIANNGPGPFTTLRVVIATVNGMSFATSIPIVGINALDVALSEWRSAEYPTTAILFNAFGNDLYALIEDDKKPLFKGVIAIDQLIEMMQRTGKTIRFLGNGTALHQELITEQLGKKAFIPAIVSWAHAENKPHILNNWKNKSIAYAIELNDEPLLSQLYTNGIRPLQEEVSHLLYKLVGENKDVAFVPFLVQRLEADPNYSPDKKMTVLMQAVKNGNKQMVKALLEQDADPNLILDSQIGSAIQIAFENGFVEIERLLRQN